MSIKEDLPLIEELKEIFAQIQNIDPGSLIREEELGKLLSFSDYFDDFVRIINFYKRLTYLDISSLPNSQLTTIKTKATTFLSYINSIQSFTVDANNAMPQRDAVAYNLINSYQDAFFFAVCNYRA